MIERITAGDAYALPLYVGKSMVRAPAACGLWTPTRDEITILTDAFAYIHDRRSRHVILKHSINVQMVNACAPSITERINRAGMAVGLSPAEVGAMQGAPARDAKLHARRLQAWIEFAYDDAGTTGILAGLFYFLFRVHPNAKEVVDHTKDALNAPQIVERADIAEQSA